MIRDMMVEYVNMHLHSWLGYLNPASISMPNSNPPCVPRNGVNSMLVLARAMIARRSMINCGTKHVVRVAQSRAEQGGDEP